MKENRAAEHRVEDGDDGWAKEQRRRFENGRDCCCLIGASEASARAKRARNLGCYTCRPEGLLYNAVGTRGVHRARLGSRRRLEWNTHVVFSE